MINQSRIAIVTGGLSGMGRAISKRLVEDDMRVVVGARRGADPRMIQELKAEIGDQISCTMLDVRDSGSCAQFVGRVIADHHRVDILVNAAGVYDEATMIDHPDSIWDDTIDTNLTGSFKMIRAVMPTMTENKWGRIINIASVAAHQGMPRNAAYCASKAGLLGLGRCVNLEGAADGITCNSISPTWVETEMLKSFIDQEVAQGVPRSDVVAKYEASNPQNKLVQPEEIADLVAFLASDAGRAMTMEDFQVNAGSLW